MFILTSDDDRIMRIGREMYRLRKKRKVNQVDLAEKLNRSRRTLYNWEQERTDPTFDEVMLYLSELGYEIVIQERTYPRR